MKFEDSLELKQSNIIELQSGGNANIDLTLEQAASNVDISKLVCHMFDKPTAKALLKI